MANATSNDIAEGLEAFIRGRFQVPAGDPHFTRDANLWEGGFVDSVGVVEMIMYLEKSLRMTIPDTVLFAPEFSTINGISTLLSQPLTGESMPYATVASDEEQTPNHRTPVREWD